MLLQRPITKTLRPAARWLARKLVYANSYSESKNDVNRVFGRRHPDVVANSPKLIAAPWGGRGLGFGAAGSGSAFDVANTLVLSKSSAVRSIFFRIALPSTTASGTVFSDAQHERLYFDALGETLSWRRKFSTTNGEWSFSGVFSSGSLTKWFSVALTHDGTTSQPVVYVNGVKVAVTTVTAPVGTYSTDTSSKFSLGAAESFFSVYTPDMVFGDFFVFDSILSQSEVLDLHRDRSALWANSPINIWLDGPQTGWVSHLGFRTIQPTYLTSVASARRVVAISPFSGQYGVAGPAKAKGTLTAYYRKGVGRFGHEMRQGGGDFNAAVTGFDSGASSFETVIVKLGSVIDGSANRLLQDTPTTSGLAVSGTAIRLIASSSIPVDISGITVSPGDCIAFRGRPNDYAVFHRGVKYTNVVNNYGSVRINDFVRTSVQSLAGVWVFPDQILSDAETFALLNNPWKTFAPEPRRFWSGGLLDWVAPPFVRRSQPQIPVGADRRSLAVFTPSRAGRFTTRAGTMTQVNSRFGLGLESSLSTNRIEQLNPNGVLLPSSRLSMFFVGRIGATSGGMGVASVLNGTTTYSAMLYVYGGADYAGFYPYNAGNMSCTLVPVKGYDVVIVGSYDGATARLGVRNLNTNQKQINSGALVGSSDFDRFRVGPTFSSQLFSTYFSGAFLDPLSTGEINAILDNPWRLLTRDPYVLHGAAGISTGIPFLSLATVINILQTQATPRVTVTF